MIKLELPIYWQEKKDKTVLVSMIDKFLNDALKENGIIADDNVKIYKRITGEVAGQDKQNPRVEIEVEEIVEL